MIWAVGLGVGAVYALWAATLWGAAHAQGPVGSGAVVLLVVMPILAQLVPGAPAPLPFAFARAHGWLDMPGGAAALTGVIVAACAAGLIGLRKVGYLRWVEARLTPSGARTSPQRTSRETPSRDR